MADQPLDGGITNAGRIVRSGGHVLRPATPFTGSVHRFLAAIVATGWDGTAETMGLGPGWQQTPTVWMAPADPNCSER